MGELFPRGYKTKRRVFLPRFLFALGYGRPCVLMAEVGDFVFSFFSFLFFSSVRNVFVFVFVFVCCDDGGGGGCSTRLLS